MMDLDRRRQVGPCKSLRLLAHDHDLLRAFGADLPRDGRHVGMAFNGLPAGHGDGIVVENLVGDIDACRGGGADRK
jgi:hypothetical protein